MGKTSDLEGMELAMQKHPHMRGEDVSHSARKVLFEETPPHAWGRLAKGNSKLAKNRNTPTCVGKTDPRLLFTSGMWKHPHMRGEDPILICQQCGQMETPPHAWGRRERA